MPLTPAGAVPIGDAACLVQDLDGWRALIRGATVYLVGIKASRPVAVALALALAAAFGVGTVTFWPWRKELGAWRGGPGPTQA